jgi:hypothetical protein
MRETSHFKLYGNLNKSLSLTSKNMKKQKIKHKRRLSKVHNVHQDTKEVLDYHLHNEYQAQPDPKFEFHTNEFAGTLKPKKARRMNLTGTCNLHRKSYKLHSDLKVIKLILIIIESNNVIYERKLHFSG